LVIQSLEDRMKSYETKTNYKLESKIPVVGRVDGKGFSKFTRSLKDDADSPWNVYFCDSMIDAALAACKEIQGCKAAYVQSDEISFLVTDTSSLETQPYFDYKTRKINSIVASTVSLEFYASLIQRAPKHVNARPRFDSRFWNLPEDEVVNMFIWRQRDAIRNSIQMYARHFFSHKEVDKKSTSDMMLMLKDNGTPWDSLPKDIRSGTLITKESYEEDVMFERNGVIQTVEVSRTRWVAKSAPIFSDPENREIITSLL
jgi:tRNA(His) guanylyltransferase